jgi:N utilization substance protein B
MNARRAARELALLTLFQMDKQGNGAIDPSLLERTSLQGLVLSSVRALTAEAQANVQEAADELAAVSRSMLEYEMEHPDNLNTPLDVAVKPVPIPTTRDMIERIERCLESAEYLFEALRIPELVALLRQEDVQNYASRLMKAAVEHREALDEQLNRHMQEWRMDRLVRMDAYILRLAAAEMKYVSGVDLSVSINEAVDLAKQFSAEESYRLINGVLGSLATEVAEETNKTLAGVQQAVTP